MGPFESQMVFALTKLGVRQLSDLAFLEESVRSSACHSLCPYSAIDCIYRVCDVCVVAGGRGHPCDPAAAVHEGCSRRAQHQLRSRLHIIQEELITITRVRRARARARRGPTQLVPGAG